MAHPRQEIRLGLAYGIRPGFHHKGRNDFAQLLQKLPLLVVPAVSVRLHLKAQNAGKHALVPYGCLETAHGRLIIDSVSVQA